MIDLSRRTMLGAAIKRCGDLEERIREAGRPRDVIEHVKRKELLRTRRLAVKHARALLVQVAKHLGV